jgi:glutamate dehydrogenase
VATVAANAVVNRAGISFLSRLCDETGLSLPVLARAHVIARDVYDARTTWSEIDALDLVCPASAQNEMFLAVRRLVERAARWLVRHGGDLALGPAVDRFRPGVQSVLTALPDLLAGDVADAAAETTDRLVAQGVPKALAQRVAVSDAALAALPVVDLAARHHADPLTVARVQFVLDAQLGFDRVRRYIAELPRADRWQTEARAALRDDFYESQHALTDAVITETDAAAPPEARVEAWLATRAAAVDRYRGVLADVERAGVFDLATLAVLRRALRELAALD